VNYDIIIIFLNTFFAMFVWVRVDVLFAMCFFKNPFCSLLYFTF